MKTLSLSVPAHKRRPSVPVLLGSPGKSGRSRTVGSDPAGTESTGGVLPGQDLQQRVQVGCVGFVCSGSAWRHPHRIPAAVLRSLVGRSTAAARRAAAAAAAGRSPADTGPVADCTGNYLEVNARVSGWRWIWDAALLQIGWHWFDKPRRIHTSRYLLHSSAVMILQKTCRSPDLRMMAADTSTPRDLSRTRLKTCTKVSRQRQNPFIHKTVNTIWKEREKKNMHNACTLARWQAQTTFSKRLASMWGTKRHPGERLRFPLHQALTLTHMLKSEIPAHRRGQYGHRHTGWVGGTKLKLMSESFFC